MRKRRIKIGKFRTVFRGKLSKVLHAAAILPNGKKTVFERIVRPGSVGIFAIDHKGRLLLTREYRYRQKKYVWGVPGGRVDEGESPKAAAQRELREEAGIKARRLSLFSMKDTSQTIEWKQYFYVATGLIDAPLPSDDGEDIRIVPVPLRKAARMAIQGKIHSDKTAFLILRIFAKRTGFKI